MKENVTKRSHYVLPVMRAIAPAQTKMFCASNGETEKYGTGSIWDLGDDNE